MKISDLDNPFVGMPNCWAYTTMKISTVCFTYIAFLAVIIL